MKKFIALCILALAVTNTAFASDSACNTFSSQIEGTKLELIGQAENPIVSNVVLGSTRDSLNGIMDGLNGSGLTEDICPVGNLSAEIAQILQAVSDLEQRNAERLANAAS